MLSLYHRLPPKNLQLGELLSWVAFQECPEILAIQLAGSSEIEERMMLLLKAGMVEGIGICWYAEPMCMYLESRS